MQLNPRILAFADWYLPGQNGGGAVTAIANVIELLGDEYGFYVYTRDRDSGEKRRYEGIRGERWKRVGKAEVFYASKPSLRSVRRRIREVEPDIIYLNSFFSRLTVETLLLRKLGVLPGAAIVVAPRGEFSPGALGLKGFRKWIYRKVAFAGGLYRDVTWQASSKLEEEQVRAMIAGGGAGNGGRVVLAPDVPSPGLWEVRAGATRPKKRRGAVRLVFLSRIARMKNLHFALEMAGLAEGEIELDIYGPVEDEGYWEECRERMRGLPSSVRVRYRGAVAQEEVAKVFGEYHFQLLPTLGENFGYVIVEALAAGCPVVMSDETPWRGLREKAAGWDLPLGEREKWREAIAECVRMNEEEYREISRGARRYFEEWMAEASYRSGTVELFEKAMGKEGMREEAVVAGKDATLKGGATKAAGAGS
ncbi:MAG: glycosyltransferase family 4 protein [Acidobacteriia bacterium]|nr:glycosyltransferase family 4 protein [Terriglobia bacterium]